MDVMMIGTFIQDVILSSASLLKSDGIPGYVALAFALGLLFAWWQFSRRSSARKTVLGTIRTEVLKFPDIPAFSEGFEEFRAKMRSRSATSELWHNVNELFEEYQETIVRENRDGRVILRNSVRPANFLNLDDLSFGPGIYRILPSIFVSLGLFFTFLGLIGALDGLGTDMGAGGSNQDAVTNLMKIASAKFIMSLTGLACSIVFTFIMRRQIVALDADLHALCLAIERRLSFVSLEEIGFDQLAAIKEQQQNSRDLGLEMVTLLGNRLGEVLPAAITASITTAMGPIFDKVGNIGTTGMEGMVGDLSKQISGSVGNALTKASDALSEASERIAGMVEQMNQSSGRMGAGMETALAQMATAIGDLRSQVEATGQTAASTMNEGAERLLSVMNSTLEGIRDNTSEGARAMSAAAEKMRNSAEGFRTTLEAAAKDGSAAVTDRMEAASTDADAAIRSAGQSMLESFGKTSAEIARLGNDMSATVGHELIGRLKAIAAPLEDLVSAIETGAEGMRTASGGLRSGAESIAQASVAFGGASRELIRATEPVRLSHERIEQNMRVLTTATETTSTSLMSNSQRIASDAADVLASARAALGKEREGIDLTLQAARLALGKITEQAIKLDDLDEKMGRALENYANTLEQALGSAQNHILEMHKILEPGIDTLKSVVENAESFMPQSRRA